MKVYIVTENQYEWSKVKKVFDSKEKAVAYRFKKEQKLDKHTSFNRVVGYSIIEKEVV